MFTGFDDTPILSRDSDLFGLVQVYPSQADPSSWSCLPFLLETSRGGWVNGQVDAKGPGLRLLVRADCVHAAFHHTPLLSMQDLWEDVEAEVMQP